VYSGHFIAIFTLGCTETVWRPGSALPRLLAGFKGWAPGKRKRGKERKEREEGRRDATGHI